MTGYADWVEAQLGPQPHTLAQLNAYYTQNAGITHLGQQDALLNLANYWLPATAGLTPGRAIAADHLIVGGWRAFWVPTTTKLAQYIAAVWP